MSPWFREYLMANTPGERWDRTADLAVRVCMHLDEAQYVLDCAQRFVRRGACTPANAKTLFFALEKTGDGQYEAALRQVMAELDARSDAAPDLADACEMLPFRMAYEMKLNRMERVGMTAAMFRDVHQRLWSESEQRHNAHLREEAWFLMALTDAVRVCSDQLYEHWRALVDIYRETLRGVLPRMQEADPQTMALLLFALLSGVCLGLIDPERYLPRARKGIDALRSRGELHAAEALERVFGVK